MPLPLPYLVREKYERCFREKKASATRIGQSPQIPQHRAVVPFVPSQSTPSHLKENGWRDVSFRCPTCCGMTGCTRIGTYDTDERCWLERIKSRERRSGTDLAIATRSRNVRRCACATRSCATSIGRSIQYRATSSLQNSLRFTRSNTYQCWQRALKPSTVVYWSDISYRGFAL